MQEPRVGAWLSSHYKTTTCGRFVTVKHSARSVLNIWSLLWSIVIITTPEDQPRQRTESVNYHWFE